MGDKTSSPSRTAFKTRHQERTVWFYMPIATKASVNDTTLVLKVIVINALASLAYFNDKYPGLYSNKLLSSFWMEPKSLFLRR